MTYSRYQSSPASRSNSLSRVVVQPVVAGVLLSAGGFLTWMQFSGGADGASRVAAAEAAEPVPVPKKAPAAGVGSRAQVKQIPEIEAPSEPQDIQQTTRDVAHWAQNPATGTGLGRVGMPGQASGPGQAVPQPPSHPGAPQPVQPAPGTPGGGATPKPAPTLGPDPQPSQPGDPGEVELPAPTPTPTTPLPLPTEPLPTPDPEPTLEPEPEPEPTPGPEPEPEPEEPDDEDGEDGTDEPPVSDDETAGQPEPGEPFPGRPGPGRNVDAPAPTPNEPPDDDASDGVVAPRPQLTTVPGFSPIVPRRAMPAPTMTTTAVPVESVVPTEPETSDEPTAPVVDPTTATPTDLPRPN